MIFEWLHHPLAQAAGWALVHSVWELAGLALGGGILLRVLRGSSANVRYVCAAGVLLVMAAAPVATFVRLRPAPVTAAGGSGGVSLVVLDMPQNAAPAMALPAEEREITYPSGHGAAAALAASSLGGQAVGEGALGARASAGQSLAARLFGAQSWAARFLSGQLLGERSLTDYLRPALPYAVAFYLLGLVLFALRLFAGYLRLRYLRRTGAPAAAQNLLDELVRRMGIKRGVGLLESALVEVPTILGALRPVILVPMAALTGLTTEQLSAVLAHELAHVRRHDYVANLVQSLIETVLFYHPAVWWVAARIRAEREHCCDDLAAALCGGPVKYADALTRMEALRAPEVALGMRARLALGALGRAGGSALLPRVRRLLGLPARRAAGARYLTISSAAAAMLLLAAFGYLIAGPRSGVAKAADETARGKTVQKGDGADHRSDVAKNGAATDAGHTDANLLSDGAAGESEADRKIDKALDTVMDLTADQQSFDKIIKYMASAKEINLVVDEKALEAAGIDSNTPVSVDLKGVPFRKVLATVLHNAGGGAAKLDYSVEDGVLTVTTKEELESPSHLVTKIYDVRDLLVEVNEPVMTDAQKTLGGVAPAPHEALLKGMVGTIESVVASESWRDNGGTVGSIRELNGQLIITQTKWNQAQVAAVLQQLRVGRSIQISLEERIISVDEKTFKLLEATVMAEKDPKAAGAAANKFDPKLSPSLLTPEALADLMKTVEASPATTLVAAPRVTLFNWQKGTVSVTTAQNYISGYRIKNPGTAEAEYTPEMATVSPGIELHTQASVTADHRYVVAKLELSVSKLQSIDEVAAPNVPEDKKLKIQVPALNKHEVTSMLSIPDGNTAVVGGTRVPGEDGQVDRYLLFLIRPKVIVQSEATGETRGESAAEKMAGR